MRWVLAAVAATMLAGGAYWMGINRGAVPPTAQSQGAAPASKPPSAVTAPAADPGSRAAQGYRVAAQRARQSVVNVYTATRRPKASPWLGFPSEDGPVSNSLGSGVIVTSEGYILTNNHVIEGADRIAVALPAGNAVAAKVVGTDPESDLAVLKVKADGLAAITFGDSDALQVGDVVLAVGDPFGVGQTVTQGIVSATGRNRLGINTFENFIQTDAAINPGNSGGALVDIEGKLVGINSAIFSKSGGFQGIGFAIPVSLAREVMDQIIAKGRVERGWLGVQAQDLTPEVAAAVGAKAGTGALISDVARGGPAERGGLQPGDIVREIGGKAVADTASLVAATAAMPPGSRMQLAIERAGRRLTLDLTLGRRPPLRSQ